MSDLKGELSKEDQERYANGFPTNKMRRRGLAGLAGAAAAGTLAFAATLPSGDAPRPNIEESSHDENVIVYQGSAIIKEGANIRLDHITNEPNTVGWNTIVTEDGSLADVDEFKIKNPVITLGHNPDGEQPDEKYKKGEWINFPDTQGRWLKVSLSNKTSGLVKLEEGGKRLTGHPDSDDGFIANDKSTTLAPEEIAVVELVNADQ